MIRAEHISKKYKTVVLKDISFTAEKGEIIGILGANGCGKTTLLTILAGAVNADGGALYYNNEPVFKKPRLFRRYTGYVPQGNPLIEELSCRDNIFLWTKGSIKELLAREEIKSLGIDQYLDKRVSKLSGGMKRRLSIAIALSEKPSVLILDEPGNALDLKGRAEMGVYIKNYALSGGTVVMSTHIEGEIDLCTKLYIIKNGVLVPVPEGIDAKEIAKLI